MTVENVNEVFVTMLSGGGPELGKETWRGKHGGNMGKRHFYVRSRFAIPRFEIISVRTACEIGYVSLFRFQSFEITE